MSERGCVPLGTGLVDHREGIGKPAVGAKKLHAIPKPRDAYQRKWHQPTPMSDRKLAAGAPLGHMHQPSVSVAKKNVPTGPSGKETDVGAFRTTPSLQDELLNRLPLNYSWRGEGYYMNLEARLLALDAC
jgi:hypothetical protein